MQIINSYAQKSYILHSESESRFSNFKVCESLTDIKATVLTERFMREVRICFVWNCKQAAGWHYCWEAGWGVRDAGWKHQ